MVLEVLEVSIGFDVNPWEIWVIPLSRVISVVIWMIVLIVVNYTIHKTGLTYKSSNKYAHPQDTSHVFVMIVTGSTFGIHVASSRPSSYYELGPPE